MMYKNKHTVGHFHFYSISIGQVMFKATNKKNAAAKLPTLLLLYIIYIFFLMKKDFIHCETCNVASHLVLLLCVIITY